MKRKNLFFFNLIFLGYILSANGQSLYSGITCPPNIDFELGNLSYWSFKNGTCSWTSGPLPVYSLTPSAPVFTRESLVAGTGTDPRGGWPVVDPGGGAYALLLGDNITGYLTEEADYFVHIPSGVNNYSLIYRYAVVLENPTSHGTAEQPRFTVNAFDSATSLPTPCAQYTYVSGSGLPGFFQGAGSTTFDPIWCKDWTTVSINLSGLSGKTVDIQVIAQDCTRGGHYGYGYFDMTCGLFAIDSKICDDTLATLTGPPGFNSYTWYDSLTFTHVFGTTQVITMPIPDTQTTFAVIIEPFVGFGCPDTLYTRVMPSYLRMHASNDTLICAATSVPLHSYATDSALDMPLVYSWTPATGLSCTNCANPIATPTLTTSYIVKVTDKAGCSKIDTVNVTADKVIASTSVVNDSCYAAKNGAATVNLSSGTPPYGYIWNTLPIQTTKTATGLSKGTYSVAITDNIGCKGSATAKITEPAANNLSIKSSAGPTTCFGKDGYIILAGLTDGTTYTINYTYNGIPSSQTQTAITGGLDSLTKLSSGVYDHITINVTLLPPPFCSFNTVGPLTLVDPPKPPRPSVGNNGPICLGDTLKLSASDGVDSVSFLWSGPSGFSWAVPDTVLPDTPIANAAFAYAGVYTVTVTKHLCVNSYTTNVVIKPIPDPVATGDSVCSGSDIHLSGISLNGATSYRWDGPDAYSSFLANPVITAGKFNATGTYTLTATLNGCTATALTNVMVVQTPDAPLVSDTVYCQFDNPVPPLKATGVNLTWYDPNGNQMLITPIPATDVAGKTTWSVTQQTSDPNPRVPTCISPKSYETVQVYSKYFPSLVVSDSAICTGNEITFTVNNAGDDKDGILWSLAAGDTFKNVNPLRHSFDAIGTYTVSVTPLHKFCPNPTLTQQLHVFPFPVLDLGPDTAICLGSQSITLADNINAGTKNARWLWNTNETSPSIVVTKPGIYYAKLNINGCPTSDTVTVLNDCYLNIPNVFTPNNDGSNDYFFPRQFLTKGLTSFKMDIYNRWGQLVFTTNSLNGMGWDGKLNDIPQPEGVYVYVMEATFKDGQIEHHNGNITLLR